MRDLKVKRVHLEKAVELVKWKPFLSYKFARYIASFVTMTMRRFAFITTKTVALKKVYQESSSFSPSQLNRTRISYLIYTCIEFIAEGQLCQVTILLYVETYIFV